jgi:hypothetical protein
MTTTTKGQHTPGPWRARESRMSRDGNLWFIGPVGDDIAETYSRADARLIAAAPEMLAVIKM